MTVINYNSNVMDDLLCTAQFYMNVCQSFGFSLVDQFQSSNNIIWAHTGCYWEFNGHNLLYVLIYNNTRRLSRLMDD